MGLSEWIRIGNLRLRELMECTQTIAALGAVIAAMAGYIVKTWGDHKQDLKRQIEKLEAATPDLRSLAEELHKKAESK